MTLDSKELPQSENPEDEEQGNDEEVENEEEQIDAEADKLKSKKRKKNKDDDKKNKKKKKKKSKQDWDNVCDCYIWKSLLKWSHDLPHNFFYQNTREYHQLMQALTEDADIALTWYIGLFFIEQMIGSSR